MSFRFFPTAYSLQLWVYKKANEQDLIFFKRYLKSNDVVVDVGANIGILTCFAAQLVGNKEGRVFSIEAHPQTYKYLVSNVSLNKFQNVEIYNTALGASKGTLAFESNARIDDQNKVSLYTSESSINVPLNRLDDIISPSVVNLLKIDVEGFEAEVLKGSSKMLKVTQCIYFESWEEHYYRYGYTTIQVLALLNESGFSIYRFLDTDQTELEEVGKDYISANCENLLAIRDKKDFMSRTGYRI
jgi:FkbM family methyltransferase